MITLRKQLYSPIWFCRPGVAPSISSCPLGAAALLGEAGSMPWSVSPGRVHAPSAGADSARLACKSQCWASKSQNHNINAGLQVIKATICSFIRSVKRTDNAVRLYTRLMQVMLFSRRCEMWQIGMCGFQLSHLYARLQLLLLQRFLVGCLSICNSGPASLHCKSTSVVLIGLRC